MGHFEVISGQLLDKSLEEKKTLAAACPTNEVPKGTHEVPRATPEVPQGIHSIP